MAVQIAPHSNLNSSSRAEIGGLHRSYAEPLENSASQRFCSVHETCAHSTVEYRVALNRKSSTSNRPLSHQHGTSNLLICYACGNIGHLSTNCPQKKTKFSIQRPNAKNIRDNSEIDQEIVDRFYPAHGIEPDLPVENFRDVDSAFKNMFINSICIDDNLVVPELENADGIWAPISINGNYILALLDTGSNVSVISSRLVENSAYQK